MDIQVGDRVTYKSLNEPNYQKREKIVINEDEIIKILECVKDEQIEIFKLERPKYELVEEKKELLTEEEKEFLKSYIKFTNYIPNKICKDNSEHRILFYVDEYLRDKYEFFETFKNLEDSKIYTLKELGLV